MERICTNNSMAIDQRYSFVPKYKKDCIYLTSIVFNEKMEVIIGPNGLLPSIQLYGDESDSGELFSNFSISSEAFNWARQSSLDWDPILKDVSDESNAFSYTLNNLLTRIQDVDGTGAFPKFKRKYLEASLKVLEVFKLASFGTMINSPEAIQSSGCINLVHIASTSKLNLSNRDLEHLKMNWKSVSKADTSIYANKALWHNYHSIYQKSQTRLDSGLYIALFYCLVTVKGPSND